MNLMAVLMVFFVLISMVFISGCTQSTSDIKSKEDVSNAVTNISENVEEVSSILNEIDNKLG